MIVPYTRTICISLIGVFCLCSTIATALFTPNIGTSRLLCHHARNLASMIAWKTRCVAAVGMVGLQRITLPETNIASENGWFEY